MKITNLSFSYKNFKIFENFNFDSNEKIIALKGSSGCGKTTLLKLISKNLNPTGNNSIDYVKSTYFVIQEDSLFPWLTGIENILQFIDINEKKIKDNHLFPFLESFIYKKSSEMSYGQRRMIELFRAILYCPDLLLLDEPFNFLDKTGRNIFTTAILQLVANGTKIILTSHYNEDLSELGSKIFYFSGSFPISTLNEIEN